MATPTINFKGFVYDDAGAAISGATINLYDKNDTATSRASTTTNSSGFWEISHTSSGEFDVQVTSGSSKRRIKFDDAIQLSSVDTENLYVRANEGAIAAIHLFADEGEDLTDRWRIDAGTDGVLGFGNDTSVQGTYVDQFTITPNSTVADSVVAILGKATDANTLTLSTVAAAGSDTDKFLVLDGSGNVDYRTGTQVLSDIGGTGATALDDIGTGDAAASLVTTVGNITIDAQANDADVIIKVDDNGSAVTAVTFDGSDEGNAIFVNDVQLKSDGALLEFGTDLDTTLTHTDGTGLTLNSTNKLTFGDAATFIHQSSDGVMTVDGEATIDLNASTAVLISNDLKLDSDSAVINMGAGDDVTITHDGTTGATISGTPMVYQSLATATLADDTHAGVVLEMLAGESLAVGDWVYVDSTDARVSKADANDTGDNGHYPAIGVAVSAQGSAGSAVKILTHGTYNDSDGFGGDLTEGNLLYLSETAGGITATAPSDDGDMVQVVGVAIGPRDVFVNPSLVVVEVA